MALYKKHYLTNVILRVDFLTPIEQLTMAIDPKIKELCAKYFPIAEEKLVEDQEIEIINDGNSQKTAINKKQRYEWIFWGKNREKQLTLTENCLIVDMREYLSFKDLKEQFFDILFLLVAIYPEVKMNRIGLRYIDQIDLDGEKGNRGDWSKFWKKYIDPKLLQSIQFANEENRIARQMNLIEMNYDEFMLRFQYGIFNEDYPAPNKKYLFVLDTDVYSVGVYDCTEIETLLNEFHKKTIEWFERSIKDALRIKMGAQNEDAK
ncbi:TIGR04255 family protein [Macellibacteroides fermentans]|uniref:TIGR04255 family protein n=1 Tax=Macellibacteroides fermentans TaxID=879969 RepID=UPI00406D043F